MMLKIKNNIFKILIELFIFNKKKRSKIKARWAKKHLKKYVNAALKNLDKIGAESEYKNPNITIRDEVIWQYWHQGKENTPDLIKRCFESVEKFENPLGAGKKIIVLSFDSVKDYVKIPEKYYEMVKKGKMKIAHFSDIVRVYLLKEYGGLWIDSTIFLTDKVPQNVWESVFSVFQKDPEKDPQENKMTCYFIRAKYGSKNVLGILRALENYWAENDFCFNYFMFEHISTMLYDLSPELKAEWDKMPKLNSNDAGEMQRKLYCEFDEKIWNEMLKKTGIHKLSYKAIRENSSGSSFYDYILR